MPANAREATEDSTDSYVPKGSSGATDSARESTEDSLEFSKYITTTDTARTAPNGQGKLLDEGKGRRARSKMSIFDGMSCSSKILGIHRRKDISGPPLVPPFLYNQRNKYHRKLEECHHISKENARLVKRITDIYVKEGQIDNQLVDCPRMNRPGWFRHHKLAQIVNENSFIYRRLQEIKPMISRDYHLDWYAEQEDYMERISTYPLFFKNQPCSKESIITNHERRYACLQIGYGKKQQETENLIIELFTQKSPAASKNFLEVCEGRNEFFSLKGKFIDKLVSICTSPSRYKRAYWKIGMSTDVEEKNQLCFVAEENTLKHNEAGLLTRPLRIATGEFYITIGPAPFLNGKCCIFGRLIADSLAFLDMMEERNVDTYGNPHKPMIIKGCSTASSIFELPGPYLTDNIVADKEKDLKPTPESEEPVDDDEDDEDDE